MQVCLSTQPNSDSSVSSLFYEVSLLRERNRLLALQNESLLQQLTDATASLAKKEQQIYGSENERKLVNKSISSSKIQLINLINSLSSTFPSANFVLVYEMAKNECTVESILQCLSEMCPSLAISPPRSSTLARIEKQLENRKNKLNLKNQNNRQIVHIIKQPTFPVGSQFQADLNYVVRSCSRVIRRVKRSSITIEMVNELMGHISDYIDLRKQVREVDTKYKNAEREVELGVGCRLVLKETAEYLVNLETQELQKKEQIENEINCLPVG